MSSPRAAAELAAIVLQPAVSARLREEASLAPALGPLRENLRVVRATGVLVDRGGTTVPDLERVATLSADARARIAETGRVAAEALAEAWTRGAPLAEIMLPVVARARGVSRLRHEPVVRRQMLKDAPDVLFVFGDNLRRVGMGGQAAEMRGEPNAVGIPTKIAPSMAPDAFFTDADLSKALDAFAEAFARLEAHLRAGGTIVVPEAGIGTGRAQLEQRAPTIHAVLTRAMDALDRMAAGDPGARSALAVIEDARQALAGTSKATAPVVATASTAHGRLTYAGIGSRDTPPTELARMEAVGAILQRQGWTLRSGGAEGADSAFEHGADRAAREDGTMARKEIYIPWNGFQKRSDQEPGVILASALPKAREAMEMAKRYHPAWERLSQGARLLQSRNGHQILGRDLDDPSGVVICWTEGGAIKGGTGQALRIAQGLGIPLLNLGDPCWRDATPEALAAEATRLVQEERQSTVGETSSEGRDIACFAGPDRIGSNMYAAPVRWGDAMTPEREWPCNELPYIVAKTLDPAQRADMIRRFDSAAAAAKADGKSHAEAVEIGARTVKKASRGLTLRPDWDTAKLDVMQALVADKARRNPEVGDWLIATGNGRIQAGNTWGDVFWGVALVDIPSRGIRAGQGENHLGRIWMETRDRLREERGLPPLPPRGEVSLAAKTPAAQANPAPRVSVRGAEPEFF
jgi:predicted NAD-dependent protein-ADP-ribosyltransferase YbiA (DUF1768 family)